MGHHGTINGAARHYSAESSDAVLACSLGDITVFYHRRSGQTHMVISPVPEIMDALVEAAAATAEDLHDRLSRRYDLGNAADALPEIEAHLDSLLALGLVRRA